jgi:hypothetical protein
MAAYTTTKAKKRKWQAIEVNSGLGVLACLISLGCSGYFAIVLSNPDQGRTFTLAQMKVLMANEVERIKNDPYMPPQAKAIALRAIANRGHVGPSR